MSTLPAVHVDALLAGTAKPYTRPGSRSAIDKHPLAGTVTIGELGFAGDEQGDPRVHGGPDKAVHHYAFDHYPAWREDIGDSPLLRAPGAVGENISTRGLDEDKVCLGDRFELATALLEASHRTEAPRVAQEWFRPCIHRRSPSPSTTPQTTLHHT